MLPLRRNISLRSHVTEAFDEVYGSEVLKIWICLTMRCVVRRLMVEYFLKYRTDLRFSMMTSCAQRLSFTHVPIPPLCSEQTFMIAFLYYTPLMHHEDDICVLHGR